MIIKGASVYDCEKMIFSPADIVIEEGVISKITPTNTVSGTGTDYAGKRIIPGLIDIHTHGAAGVDFISADCGDIIKATKYYAEHGVTSIFPTTISAPHESIIRMIHEVIKARSGAFVNIEGIHLEGPYINKNKAGAHQTDYIRLPDVSELKEILQTVREAGLALHITAAPEIDGADDFMREAITGGATVSIGHTNASADIVRHTLESGLAISFTHLFNAMNGLHHRDAGIIGEALLSNAFTEIICDGIHLDKTVIKLVSKVKDIDKIVIISDSMAAAGMGDGVYELGGSVITVKDGKALSGNTIAGSTANIFDELKNFTVFTGIDFETALQTVTANPAAAVGIGSKKGLQPGKDADFVVIDSGYNICDVYAKGIRQG